ncbi:uncharacterized protein LOC116618525 [Nematostella vectensis]|uniref:uncharacterized protein LOC116618525 n=1 Tax=Nematostella vectensis TaxID=45351 RepID=UPI00138FF9DF|nr:uncharacterized protein LOC116618525 [Nematostella vectensis]
MYLKLSFVMAVVAWVAVSEATTVEDKVTVRVFNKDFSKTDDEMKSLLKQADLEGNGYKKEVTTQVVKRPGQKKPNYQKQYLYYKDVTCGRVMEVEREMDMLLKGALGTTVLSKGKRVIKQKGLEKDEMCRTGVEVHFNKDQTCSDNKRQRRSYRCWLCHYCWRVDAIEK